MNVNVVNTAIDNFVIDLEPVVTSDDVEAYFAQQAILADEQAKARKNRAQAMCDAENTDYVFRYAEYEPAY